MILDQTISSARTEQNWNETGQRIIESLLTALLALILVLASLTNLAAVEWLSKMAVDKAGHSLPLAPIKSLESMPWMDWNAPAPKLRIDTLILPRSPLGVDPQTPQEDAKDLAVLS